MLCCAVAIACTQWACGNEGDFKTSSEPGFFTAIHSESILPASLEFDLDSLVYYKDAGTEDEVDGVFTVELFDSVLTVAMAQYDDQRVEHHRQFAPDNGRDTAFFEPGDTEHVRCQCNRDRMFDEERHAISLSTIKE